jgi:hypothetical protein
MGNEPTNLNNIYQPHSFNTINRYCYSEINIVLPDSFDLSLFTNDVDGVKRLMDVCFSDDSKNDKIKSSSVSGSVPLPPNLLLNTNLLRFLFIYCF